MAAAGAAAGAAGVADVGASPPAPLLSADAQLPKLGGGGPGVLLAIGGGVSIGGVSVSYVDEAGNTVPIDGTMSMLDVRVEAVSLVVRPSFL